MSGTLSDPREKDDTAAKMSLFREQGATNLKNTKFYTPATAILAGVGQATSRYNRDFFTNEVLGKGAYKGTTKQDFEKMSRASQENLYSGYRSGINSGQRDAYGNLMPGVRIENIAHKKADGTMTTRQVIMRDNSNGQTKTEAQIEAENVAAQKAAQAEADQAAAEQADAYKKKRLSITSSRSLFARPGGRGFFD